MKQYRCVECGTIYDESNVPKNFICTADICPGDGITGLLELLPDDDIKWREIGLCILLMDASGSMEDPAFKNQPYKSKYDATKDMSKREVVTDNAAKAIFELKQMVKKEDAYITVINFDHRQNEMFTKSVEEILTDFPDAPSLAKYLFEGMGKMNGGTNINSALNMAYDKTQNFLSGKLTKLGAYLPLIHTQFSTSLKKATDVPNVRVLMYTDGEQLPEFGDLESPFKSMQPDVLMGIYIGRPEDKGCNDLKKVIGKCPIHDVDQFFVVDGPQKITTLRGLFRMASGASGFCPACIGTVKPR